MDDIETDIPAFKCNCKGTYHDKCINEWFVAKENIICPICLEKFDENHIIVIHRSRIRLDDLNNNCFNLCSIMCKILKFILITSIIVYLIKSIIENIRS
jgi:hypothetical protein